MTDDVHVLLNLGVGAALIALMLLVSRALRKPKPQGVSGGGLVRSKDVKRDTKGFLNAGTDFRKDLNRVIDGHLSVNEFHDLWRDRMPPKGWRKFAKEPKPDTRKKYSVVLEGQRQPPPELLKCQMDRMMMEKFKLPQWVRVKCGRTALYRKLLRAEVFEICSWDPMERPHPILCATCADGSKIKIHAEDVEPAAPKKGEWWLKSPCSVHPQGFIGEGPNGEHQWTADADPPEARRSLDDIDSTPWSVLVKCGCLNPVNYGAGVRHGH